MFLGFIISTMTNNTRHSATVNEEKQNMTLKICGGFSLVFIHDHRSTLHII